MQHDFDVWYQANQSYPFAAFDLVHNLLQNFVNQFENNFEAKYLDIDRTS